MAAHPNKTKMDAAVARWIGEAQGRVDGAVALRKRAAWMEGQLRILGDRFARTPDHLKGLTAADLIVAEGALRDAARDHGHAKAA